MLILVFGWLRAHMSIVKTAMTFGMDIARVMPPRTKMAVGGEGDARLRRPAKVDARGGLPEASSGSFGNRDLDCPGRGVMLRP